jgi:hypothetical protein
MTEPREAGSGPTILGLVSERMRMTEGQLYTVAISALVVLLLTLTGLPSAHKPAGGLPGSATTLPPVPTTEAQPATEVQP